MTDKQIYKLQYTLDQRSVSSSDYSATTRMERHSFLRWWRGGIAMTLMIGTLPHRASALLIRTRTRTAATHSHYHAAVWMGFPGRYDERKQIRNARQYHARPLPRPFGLLSSTVADDYENDPNDDRTRAHNIIEHQLEALEQEISQLTGGDKINLNSPMQVSRAIFGDIQCVNKKALLEATTTLEQGSDPQLLARKILEYKQLQTLQRPKSTKRNARTFSSLREMEDTDNGAIVEPEATVSLESTSPVVVASTMSSTRQDDFHASVEKVFETPHCQVHEYWKPYLMDITRPCAQALIRQLDSAQCPMGFDPSADARGVSPPKTPPKRHFLDFCRDQKKQHPDRILLTRCGDFYETFGIDAIMLVEHAGLNSMGGKAKAGCPIQNIQATLDSLTEQGFEVVVIEEEDDDKDDDNEEKKKKPIKARFLSDIVTPASPDYIHEMTLKDSFSTQDTKVRSARPYVGILKLAAGYTIVEIQYREQKVRVLERLTASTVTSHLSSPLHRPVDPVWYVPSLEEQQTNKATSAIQKLLPSLYDNESRSTKLRTKILNPAMLPTATTELTEADRAKTFILMEVLNERRSNGVGSNQDGTNVDEAPMSRDLTMDDFVLVQRQVPNKDRMQPLHLETATQLGLVHDRHIPPLLFYALPRLAPPATRKMLEEWLLTPPPKEVAQAMSDLIAFVRQPHQLAFPNMIVQNIGRILTLLRKQQASAPVFREIHSTLEATREILDCLPSEILAALLTILEYESGLSCPSPEVLSAQCEQAAKIIDDIVAVHDHGDPYSLYNPGLEEDSKSVANLVPYSFVRENEKNWRGRILPSAVPEIYMEVDNAAHNLMLALSEDFGPGAAKNLVAHDIFDNMIALKKLPENLPENRSKENYKRPHDRNNRQMPNRYTTESVEKCCTKYVDLCQQASDIVTQKLEEVSRELYQHQAHLKTIIKAVHANLILSTVLHHASNAQEFGWNRAHVTEKSEDSIINLKNVWPYWMNRAEAVTNTVELKGMWMLTAPNMSGKSTLMRSTAAAALLSVCGFDAPVDKGSTLSRFDNLFVRGASSDVPSEGKSAFAAEMSDVAYLVSSCGPRSLVFVDELGRGTSPRDGTRIAAAILEDMALSGMSGVFATHLHDLIDMPLGGRDRIHPKRMSVVNDGERTFQLEDGVCRDSLALATAAEFGIPSRILDRANELLNHVPDSANICNPQEVPVPVPSSSFSSSDLDSSPPRSRLPEHPVDLAEALTEQRSVMIPPGYFCPPFLQGKACLYVLEIPHQSGDSSKSIFYIGETENLSQRIRAHRSSKNKNLSAHVIPASSRTEALHWETLLIRNCARVGVFLASKADGYHKLKPFS